MQGYYVKLLQTGWLKTTKFISTVQDSRHLHPKWKQLPLPWGSSGKLVPFIASWGSRHWWLVAAWTPFLCSPSHIFSSSLCLFSGHFYLGPIQVTQGDLISRSLTELHLEKPFCEKDAFTGSGAKKADTVCHFGGHHSTFILIILSFLKIMNLDEGFLWWTYWAVYSCHHLKVRNNSWIETRTKTE